MADPAWLEDVRNRLMGHNLPPAYVERFMAEIGDHLRDLGERTTDMDADLCSRLGEPERVADATVLAFRRRSFLGRHPVAAFLVFAASPALAYCALLTVALMSLAVCFRRGAFDWHEQRWELSLCVVVCSVLLGMLYSELALRLGLAKKWTITSGVVLGVMAMFWDLGAHRYAGAELVMLPLQFAVPLGLGKWLAERTWNRDHLATTFLIFAVSPVVSYAVLFLGTAMAFLSSQELICERLGPAVETMFFFVLPLLLFVLAAVVAGRSCWKLAGGLGAAKKWMLVGCLVLAMLPSLPFLPIALIHVAPTAVASFLYCKLAWRSGAGPRWMFVSCTVLAASASVHYFGNFPSWTYSGPLAYIVPIGVFSIGVVQFLAPLVIGWWFLRRRNGQGRLQVAS